MTSKTYFTTTFSDDPAGITRWHITHLPNERRRLRARGWQRVRVADMSPDVRWLIQPVIEPGTYRLDVIGRTVEPVANAAARYA